MTTIALFVVVLSAAGVMIALMLLELRELQSELRNERERVASLRRLVRAHEWRDTWDDVTEDLGHDGGGAS